MQLESIKGALSSGGREGRFRDLVASTPFLALHGGFFSRGVLRRPLARLAAVALVLAPQAAWADPDPLNPTRLPPQVIYNYGEHPSTRAAGMGGALRAIGVGTSAALLNPADMVETRVYHAGALSAGSPEARTLLFGSTVVDSITGKLAGAITLLGGWVDAGDDPGRLNRSFIDARVSLAYPITERIFLGLAGRYAKISQLVADTPFARPSRDGKKLADKKPFSYDPVAGGLVDTDDPKSRYSLVNELTLDAGLTIKASDNIYLAALGQNLTYPNNGLLPTIAGGGIGFTSESLSLEADGVADFTSWSKPKARVMVGGEYVVSDHVPLRLGYKFDQGASLHTLSFGTGYVANEFAIEAAVTRTLSSPGVTSLFFSAEYFFEASGMVRATAPELQ